MFVNSGHPKEDRALAILQYILPQTTCVHVLNVYRFWPSERKPGPRNLAVYPSTDNLCPRFKCLSILAVRKKTGPSQSCIISCALPQTTCVRVSNVYRFWPSERRPGPRNLAVYPALFHRQLVSAFQMFIDSGHPKEDRALAILQYILRSSTDNLCPRFKCLSILAVRKKTGPSQSCRISRALPQKTCVHVLNVYQFWPSERRPGPRNLAVYPALFHRKLVSTF